MDAQNSPGFRGTMSAAMFPEIVRLNTWREMFGREFLKLDIDPLDDQPFRHDIDYLALPELNISTGSVSAVRYEQTREMIANASDHLTLLVPRVGKIELHQRGREALVRQGDALIRRSCDVGHTFSSAGEHLAVMVPRESVAHHAGDIGQFGFAVVQRDNATLSLLKNYLQMLMSDTLIPPQNDALGRYTAEMISRHIHEVVGLLLGASRDSWAFSGEAGGGLFATRIAAIHAEIAANAMNPDFSVHDVARKLDISAGYVRKLLAAQEQRFSDLVRTTRLDFAHRRLRAPHLAHVDITGIALESGFNDISYFNRCFKQRFGMTPSDARHATA